MENFSSGAVLDSLYSKASPVPVSCLYDEIMHIEQILK